MLNLHHLIMKLKLKQFLMDNKTITNLYIGWQNKHRVFGPVMHFDIKNGKIWIQWNGTEEDVGEQLTAMGVPKHDIVVGFQPSYIRQYTDYTVG